MRKENDYPVMAKEQGRKMLMTSCTLLNKVLSLFIFVFCHWSLRFYLT